MKFVLVKDRYNQIIPLLTRVELGFVISPEYGNILGTGEDIVGVVASAYAAYISRRCKEGAGNQAMQQLVKPLNELATWNENRVRELLQDEVFEGLETAGETGIVEEFGNETLRALMSEWQASISDANGGA